MTPHTLYTESPPGQHKSYICHLTLYIWHYIHCICVINPSVSNLLHPLSVWHCTLYVCNHIQHAWHHMNNLWHHTHIGMTSSSIFMTSYPIYMISPILFHENKTTLPGIWPTVFDITANASVLSQTLYRCFYNNYGSPHTWHTYDIINTLYRIKFRLYDINGQYLGHYNHCIHDIRSPIYDITSTVYDISSTVPVTSQPLYQ